MNSPGEGELVESGTFRVDTEKMLEVLSRYQLQAPEYFIRACIRCAVASGASEVRLERASGAPGTGFELGFDGRLFTKEELSDVYAPLLAGSQDRGRHLAAGILALVKTAPSLLTISSGGAPVLIAGTAEPAPEVYAPRTLLRALWRAEPRDLPLEKILDFPAESDAAIVCCPVAVRAPGGESPPFKDIKPQEDSIAFEEDGRRGFIFPALDDGSTPVTDDIPEADSTVALHVLGVYAETHTMRMSIAPVSADFNDDSLSLDASFSKCVRNEQFDAALAFLEKQAEKLLLHEIKKQKEDLAAVGRFIRDIELRELWRRRMMYLENWTDAVSPSWRDYLSAFGKWLGSREYGTTPKQYLPKPKGPARDCIFRTGPRTWWLQDACRKALRTRKMELADIVPHPLWAAPVLLSTKGKALSLADINARVKMGRLSVSKYFSGEAIGSSEAVWLASFRDELFLRECIPHYTWDEDFL
ncbi:MAG TPA: hypothetical protein PKI19_01510 [Elusimicrobiales bacterium]|nr:hypothetical protein [Elusimicrobiales bacterium]